MKMEELMQKTSLKQIKEEIQVEVEVEEKEDINEVGSIQLCQICGFSEIALANQFVFGQTYSEWEDEFITSIGYKNHNNSIKKININNDINIETIYDMDSKIWLPVYEPAANIEMASKDINNNKIKIHTGIIYILKLIYI